MLQSCIHLSIGEGILKSKTQKSICWLNHCTMAVLKLGKPRITSPFSSCVEKPAAIPSSCVMLQSIILRTYRCTVHGWYNTCRHGWYDNIHALYHAYVYIMNIWVSSHSTQTIPAAARVCAHICRAIYEISEPSLAHAQGLFMDSASQIKVQHVPRAMGQGLAHAPHVPTAGQAGQGWGAQPPSTSPVKGFPHRQKGRGAAPRNCQHWHSTVSLFRWALSGSSRICKEALMSFASPAESRGSQWTSKAGQWR